VSSLQNNLALCQNKTSTNISLTSNFRVTPRGASRREEALEACERVQDILSACFAISGRDIRSHERTRMEINRVRQIGMYLAHVTVGLSMIEVGEGFQRERSTVTHACHVIEDLRDDAEFESMLHMIERIVEIAFQRSPRR
jgi:chromosomal replication initiation ATPase DnaA